MNLDFPLVSRERKVFPPTDACPVCGRVGVGEPNSFAFLSGGASVAAQNTDPATSVRRHGFLSLVWHGAHDAGVGDDAGIYASVDLAEEVEGGAFELHFCSTACLRAFLNTCVDALEEGIASERTERCTNARDAALNTEPASPPSSE